MEADPVSAAPSFTVFSGSSTISGGVFSLSVPGHRVIVPRQAEWQNQIMSRLAHLCKLPLGWDGYRARPVSFSTAHFALSVIERICDEQTPMPSIVPGTSGDLQIEWHLEGGDIELHVRAPNDVHAWRIASGADENGEELTLDVDFTIIGRWLKELLELQRASIAAAA